MLRTKREGEDASALRLPAATQPARRLSRSSSRSNQTRTKIPSIMPCLDLQRRLRHHGSFTGERQMCKHLSHLLSPGASSRFQKAPQCSGAGERKAADEGGGFVVTSESSLTASSYAHACAIEVFVSLHGARDDVGSESRMRACLRVAFSCTITWCVDSGRFATSVRLYHLADNAAMSLQVSLIFRCGREGTRP